MPPLTNTYVYGRQLSQISLNPHLTATVYTTGVVLTASTEAAIFLTHDEFARLVSSWNTHRSNTNTEPTP